MLISFGGGRRDARRSKLIVRLGELVGSYGSSASSKPSSPTSSTSSLSSCSTGQFSVAKEDVAQQGSPTDVRIGLRRMVTRPPLPGEVPAAA